tara:strand:- start:4778 stop:5374 length:597 start_codon:yes stop_codon:yes gene_type:complete
MKPTITDIPKGKWASGTNILEPSKDMGYYENTINGQVGANPITTYCPSCSSILETDRYKNQKRKFRIKPHDLVFDIKYVKDDDELYAKCNVCGFDLRSKHYSDTSIPKNKDEFRPIKREYIIEQVKYKEGKFFIPKDEFIKLARAYIQGDRIEICIRQKIGNDTYTYIAQDGVFENPKSLVYNDSEVGISRNHWKQLK